MTEQDEHISEGEAAMMSATKAIFMVLIEAKVVPQHAVDSVLSQMRDAYLLNRMPKASGMLEHVRLFVVDPKRAADREAIGRLLRAPPKGSA